MYGIIYVAASSLILLLSEPAPNSPADAFWQSMKTMCGKAYQGVLVSTTDLNGTLELHQIMHVHACGENRVSMRFVGGQADHQMQRMLIRHADGRMELRHDYRVSGERPADVTGHGGFTVNEGSAWAQVFPADRETAGKWDNAWDVVWMLEVHPGERFVYFNVSMTRERMYRFEFDLSRPVEAPAAWVWEY